MTVEGEKDLDIQEGRAELICSEHGLSSPQSKQRFFHLVECFG